MGMKKKGMKNLQRRRWKVLCIVLYNVEFLKCVIYLDNSTFVKNSSAHSLFPRSVRCYFFLPFVFCPFTLFYFNSFALSRSYTLSASIIFSLSASLCVFYLRVMHVEYILFYLEIKSKLFRHVLLV